MSDVSAVVLSIGEAFASRAIECLSRQSYALQEVIVVENVSPFYRAFNEGARRVATPFFLQVDADMLPDPTCVEELRLAMDERTGVVCGELRDALMGQIVGIKLFRTECVRQMPFSDSVSQDTDFVKAMERAGWSIRYVGRSSGAEVPARTYGEHRPDYAPAYTFRKFLIEGRRYRYRGARGGLFSRMESFERATHPLALFAEIAQAHGFFLPTERDELKPADADPRAASLLQLLGSGTACPAAMDGLFPIERHERLRDVFRRFALAGRDMAAAGAGATVKDSMAALAGRRGDWRALVARLALGHGILVEHLDGPSLAADERALKAFVRLGIGRRVSATEYLRAQAECLYHRIRRRRKATPW
jgi:hypothetical protein